MRNVAISKAYLAMDEESRIKYAITASSANGMIRINSTSRHSDIQQLILSSEDCWYVQYFNQNNDHSRALALLWNRVAAALTGLVSVGSIEIPDKMAFPDEYAYVIENHNLQAYVADSGQLTSQIIRLFLGGNRKDRNVESAAAMIAESIRFNPEEFVQEETGLGIGYSSTVQSMVDWVVHTMAEASMPVGSATETGAKAKRLYKEAIELLKKCLEQQPYHSEIRALLADIYGYAGLKKNMKKVSSLFLKYLLLHD